MSTSWFDTPMRWLHLNLVEDDAQHADVERWSTYWRDAHVDGVTISAAGAAAHYPTAIAGHPRAAMATGRDLFGELVDAAKKRDMRVLARFEPTNISAEQVAAHPEWVVRNPDGTPRSTSDPLAVGIRDNVAEASAFASLAGPDRYAPCINGAYYRLFIPDVMTELAHLYPIDGYYANGWPRLGAGPPQEGAACHCAACVSAWRSRGSRHDTFPVVADPDDPLWRDYVAFIQDTVEDVQRGWQQHATSLRPGLTFVCNLFGSFASGLRWERFRSLVDVFVHDGQGRSPIGPSIEGPAAHAMWAASRGAHLLRAAAADRQVFHAVGAWHTGHPPLRRVSKEPVELTHMLAQAVAHGARPYCNVAGGVVHDRRWMEPLGDYYRWHAANERYLRRGRSLADVAILWDPESSWTSWSTRRRVQRAPSASDAFNGWHLTLLEARVPYDVVPRVDLQTVDLHRYRALLVPSGTGLDDDAARILARYAADSGGLVIGCGALPSSAGDGGAALRTALGLAPPTMPYGPARSAYVAVTPDDRLDPLLAGVGDTDFLGAGMWSAPAEIMDQSTIGVGTWRPPLPFLADRAFWTDVPDPRPVLARVAHCIYVGTDLDALYGCTLVPDAGQVLTNALRLAVTDRPARCDVIGEGLVDVHPWLVDDAMVVHLVNLTTERLYGGPLTSIRPIGPQAMRIRIPDARVVTGVRLLRAGTIAMWRQDLDELQIDVERVSDFEVVAVDTNPSVHRSSV